MKNCILCGVWPRCCSVFWQWAQEVILAKKVNTGAGRANQVPYAWLSHVKALVGMRNIFTHYKPLNVVINSKANLLSLLNIISSSASSGHQSEKWFFHTATGIEKQVNVEQLRYVTEAANIQMTQLLLHQPYLCKLENRCQLVVFHNRRKEFGS